MLLGVFYVALASVLFGSGGVAIRIVQSFGVSGFQQVCYQMLIGALLVFLLLGIQRRPIIINKTQLRDIVVFGSLGFGGTNLLITFAYALIPVGIASTLHFAYPLVTTLIMVILFHEKLTPIKCIAAVLVVSGMYLLGGGGQVSSMLGVICALASSLTYASFVVAQERSSMVQLNGFVTNFYIALFTGIFLIPVVLLTGGFSLPSIAAVLAMAVSSIIQISAIIFLSKGVQIMGASKAAFLNLLEPIASVFFGMLFFQEFPDLVSTVGICLVVSAVLLISMSRSQKEPDSGAEGAGALPEGSSAEAVSGKDAAAAKKS